MPMTFTILERRSRSLIYGGSVQFFGGRVQSLGGSYGKILCVRYFFGVGCCTFADGRYQQISDRPTMRLRD